MDKLGFILTILLVFSLMGSIRFLDDNQYLNGSFILHANINNRGGQIDIQNAKLKYIILDSPDVIGTSKTSSVREGDISSKKAFGELQDIGIKPGEYMVRIYIYGNDGVRRIKHREVIIN
jgi:hypothetical protein